MSNPGGRVNRQPLDERCARAIEASIGARCAGTTERLKRPARIAGTEQRRARIERRTLHPFRRSEIDCRQRATFPVSPSSNASKRARCPAPDSACPSCDRRYRARRTRDSAMPGHAAVVRALPGARAFPDAGASRCSGRTRIDHAATMRVRSIPWCIPIGHASHRAWIDSDKVSRSDPVT